MANGILAIQMPSHLAKVHSTYCYINMSLLSVSSYGKSSVGKSQGKLNLVQGSPKGSPPAESRRSVLSKSDSQDSLTKKEKVKTNCF